MTEQLTDLTPIWNQRADTHPSEKAQIIYVTKAGLDYCREPATMAQRTHAEACEWARVYFHNVADRVAKENVTAFRVEWW
jgi:hypothetical protein